MLPIQLTQDKIKNILFLGAHCDDIEIGCGGTVLRLIEQFPNANYHWFVFSSNSVREKEAQAAAAAFLTQAKNHKVTIKNFRNGYFPYVGDQIKDYFEELKKEVEPDVIFTHYRDDLHQDHRTLSQLTWNTFRNHLILEYEIAKYDGDMGTPNFFVPISRKQVDFKVGTLMQCFETQKGKQWFTEDTFKALMRIRGIECNAPESFAEAFYCRKISF